MIGKFAVALFAAAVLGDMVSAQQPTRQNLECGAHESTCLVHLFESNEKSLRCYNPATFSCKHNLLCPIGSSARCGDSCYAIGTDGFVCHQNLYLCPAALPDLCGSTCYNKDSYECSNDFLVQL